jgi:hypothetical protein
MAQNISYLPVSLEHGSWPTFSLTTRERLDIISGEGLQRGQGVMGTPPLTPDPRLAAPYHGDVLPMGATPAVASGSAGADDGPPGGISNQPLRVIGADGQVHTVGSQAPAPRAMPPGGINPAKPPIRTAGPNPGSRH